jgi:hypothetical protein
MHFVRRRLLDEKIAVAARPKKINRGMDGWMDGDAFT